MSYIQICELNLFDAEAFLKFSKLVLKILYTSLVNERKNSKERNVICMIFVRNGDKFE